MDPKAAHPFRQSAFHLALRCVGEEARERLLAMHPEEAARRPDSLPVSFQDLLFRELEFEEARLTSARGREEEGERPVRNALAYWVRRQRLAGMEERASAVKLPKPWGQILVMSSETLRERFVELGTRLLVHYVRALPADQLKRELSRLGDAAARQVAMRAVQMRKKVAIDDGLKQILRQAFHGVLEDLHRQAREGRTVNPDPMRPLYYLGRRLVATRFQQMSRDDRTLAADMARTRSGHQTNVFAILNRERTVLLPRAEYMNLALDLVLEVFCSMGTKPGHPVARTSSESRHSSRGEESQ